MTPKKLRLKHFIGIRDGMGLEEFTLDLSDLPAGLIVFDAPNGSGKTTILDNLHPFRLMPSRMQTRDSEYKSSSFSFYDQCYGDAEKEFVFEMAGVVYRSLLVIDTDRKKQEAYLYVRGEVGWEVYPGIDGKLDPYDRAIEEVCGSPQLFFTGPFRAQNAKALSDYTKGDVKDIFVELLGIEYLQTLSEKSRRVKQSLASKLEVLSSKRGDLRETIGQEERYRREIEEVGIRIGTATEKALESEDEERKLQDEISACDVKIETQKAAIGGKAEIEKDLGVKREKLSGLKTQRTTKETEFGMKITAATGKITKAEDNVKRIPELRKKADEKKTRETEVEALKKNLQSEETKRDGLQADINKLQPVESQIKEKEGMLANLRQKHQFAIANAKRSLEEAEKQAAKLDTVPCKADGDYAKTCRFVKDAAEATSLLPALKKALEDAQQEPATIPALVREIVELKESIATLPALRKDLEAATKAVTEAKDKLRPAELAVTTLTTALNDLSKLEVAEQQLPELQEELARIEKEKTNALALIDFEISEFDLDVKGLEEKAALIIVNPEIAERRATLVDLLGKARGATEKIRTDSAEDTKRLGALEESLRQVETAKSALVIVNQRINYLNGEISDWTVLEKAFGNDGVIALEIDDAGPQVSTLANELLQIHGGRFSVRIDTQATKGKGGQKETFDITVFDNQSTEQKSIRRLSGGEKTIVEDAVVKAICIYNKRASGRAYQTLYTDEKDGALDVERKKSFFDVKRKVLELGGYTREFAITHTPELQAMADGVIHMRKGGATITTN